MLSLELRERMQSFLDLFSMAQLWEAAAEHLPGWGILLLPLPTLQRNFCQRRFPEPKAFSGRSPPEPGGRGAGWLPSLLRLSPWVPWIERILVAITSLLSQYPDVLANPFLFRTAPVCMLYRWFCSIHLHQLFWSCHHVTPSTQAAKVWSLVTWGNPVFSSMLVFIAWWSDFPLWFSLMLVNSCQIPTDNELKWWGQGKSHLPLLFMTPWGWRLGWELSVYSSINPLSYFLNSSVTKSLTEKLQTGDPTPIWMN